MVHWSEKPNMQRAKMILFIKFLKELILYTVPDAKYTKKKGKNVVISNLQNSLNFWYFSCSKLRLVISSHSLQILRYSSIYFFGILLSWKKKKNREKKEGG